MTDRVYADASALVKLILEEPESEALWGFVGPTPALTTSRIADIEVTRASRTARPDARNEAQTRRLLHSCDQVAVSDAVLERARELASASLRTLDAIHLATALRVDARRFLTYDRRLADAAVAAGLRVLSPGAA